MNFDETEAKNRKLFPRIYKAFDAFFDEFNDRLSFEEKYHRKVLLASVQVAYVAGYRDGLKEGKKIFKGKKK